MGTKFSRVQIIELETTGGEWPMVYGKGKRKSDLVYFQLDGSFLRQPDRMFSGSFIAITEEEIIDFAADFYPLLDTHAKP